MFAFPPMEELVRNSLFFWNGWPGAAEAMRPQATWTWDACCFGTANFSLNTPSFVLLNPAYLCPGMWVIAFDKPDSDLCYKQRPSVQILIQSWVIKKKIKLTVGLGKLRDEWCKSDRERQISDDIAYMWNLKKNGRNEPIYKREIGSQM